MENETWRQIPGYEGCYEVSNYGQVRSIDRIQTNSCNVKRKLAGKLLLQSKGSTSVYWTSHLYRNGVMKNIMTHRLVAMAFLDNWSSELDVNHKNGDKHDNRLENLEMCTHSENVLHAYNTYLRNDSGENHLNAKLNTEEVWQIKLLHHLWGFSQHRLAKQFHISQSCISDVIRNKSYKR